MSDQAPTGAPGQPTTPPQGGTVPNKTETEGGAPTNFDPSKLSQADLDKIYEDERLYKHPRFAKLREEAKEAQIFKEQQKKREEDEAKKRGEFEQLHKQAQTERDEWKNKYTNSQVDAAIMAAASKKGMTDLDAATKLIDRSKVALNDDGTITGVNEAVEALATERPYLLQINRSTVGTGTSPAGSDTAPKKFKMSQLQDPTFFRANEVEINKAIASGQIEDDRQR